MNENTTDTTGIIDAPVEERIVLRGGPLDGDEYRTPKGLRTIIRLLGPYGEPVDYERATEPIHGHPRGPRRFVIDDLGRHVYKPYALLLEGALVEIP